MLSPFAASNGGTLAVGLYLDGKRTTRTIGSLVLTAFKGPGPEGTICLRRKGDRHNNTPGNLYWGIPDTTRSEEPMGETASLSYAAEAYPGQIEAYAETIRRIELAVSVTGDHGKGVRGFQDLVASVETISTSYIAQRDALHRIEVEVAPYCDGDPEFAAVPDDIADRVEEVVGQYALILSGRGGAELLAGSLASVEFDTSAVSPAKRSIWQRMKGWWS
jgi:hypothetical protein